MTDNSTPIPAGPSGKEANKEDTQPLSDKLAFTLLPTHSTLTTPNSKPSDHNFPELKNDTILRAAKGLPTDHVPVWMHRQAGRYLPEFREERKKADFFSLCRTPELAAKVTIQPVQRFPLDAAIVFSDILVVPQVLGLTIVMETAKGPVVTNALKSVEDLSRLKKKEDVNVYRDLGYVFDAITVSRKQLEGKVPLIGFAGGPWTLLCYMIEGGHDKNTNKAKKWLYCNPNECHQILKLISDVTTEYLIGQVQAGAQMLEVFESWAGELTPDAFAEFCLPYIKAIASGVKSGLRAKGIEPVPMTAFPRGAHYSLEMLVDTDFDVIACDWTLDPADARRRVQNKVTLQGNLEPCILYGSAETIRQKATQMVTAFGTQRYIANLGWGMLPDHTPEAAGAFVTAVHDQSKLLNAKSKAAQ